MAREVESSRVNCHLSPYIEKVSREALTLTLTLMGHLSPYIERVSCEALALTLTLIGHLSPYMEKTSREAPPQSGQPLV